MVLLNSEGLLGGWEGEGYNDVPQVTCALSFPRPDGTWVRCVGVVYEALFGPEETHGLVVGLCKKCYMAAEEVAGARFALSAEARGDDLRPVAYLLSKQKHLQEFIEQMEGK